MKGTERVEFGSVALYRHKCPQCGNKAFVINGLSACCDAKIEMNDTFVRKRVSEGAKKRALISRAIKNKILARQENMCFYCETKLDEYQWDSKKNKYIMPQIHFDHLTPWSYSQNNDDDNLVASCAQCNLCKSSLIFKTVEEARIYMLRKRGLI